MAGLAGGAALGSLLGGGAGAAGSAGLGGLGGLLGGGGGGLDGALATALILGSLGDTIGAVRGKRGRGGGITNSLMAPLLLASQFGGFGGRRGSQTRVLGQKTPTEGEFLQTTPEAGVVACAYPLVALGMLRKGSSHRRILYCYPMIAPRDVRILPRLLYLFRQELLCLCCGATPLRCLEKAHGLFYRGTRGIKDEEYRLDHIP